MRRITYGILPSFLLAFLILLLLFTRRNPLILSSDFITTLIKGGSVINLNFATWVICLLFLVLGSLVVIGILNKNNRKNLDILDTISLGLSGSPIVLAIICLGILFFGHLWILIITAGLITYIRFTLASINLENIGSTSIKIFPIFEYNKSAFIKIIHGGLFIALFIIISLVKFGYIYGLEFPLNVDSIYHVYIINNLNWVEDFQGFPYYHYGFHYIVIGLSLLTGNSVRNIILIFGQLLQTIIPFTVFFPVNRITKNYKAALFSVFIVGLGWNMPSQATSWGKYPALMALACTIFIYYINSKNYREIKNRIGQIFCLTLVIIAAIFIHSRMLILLIISFISSRIFRWVGGKNKHNIQLLLIGLIILIVVTVQYGPIEKWKLAFYPYHDVTNLLIVIILLIPFNILYFTEYTLQLVIFTILILISSIIPIPQGFNIQLLTHNASTLIDRPFLSILLFIPLSIYLGTGLAGIEKFLFDGFGQTKLFNIFLITFVIIFLIFPTQKVLKPQQYSNYVTKNDILIYDEIMNKLLSNSNILIPYDQPNYYIGLDGGGWIELVTGRQTIKMLYDMDFTSYNSLKEICDTGAEYIYIGNKPYSFSIDNIEKRKYWYEPMIIFPDVMLYKVIGCSS